jgi:sulfur carrier protein ThiS adenylyltransferase
MITINQKQVPWEADMTLASVAADFKPAADVAIVNGLFVEGTWEQVKINDNDKVVIMEKGVAVPRSEFEEITRTNILPHVFYELNRAAVGIAGLGGLGSRVSCALARVGVGKLIIADFDVVEPSNLNRQQYFIDQIGSYKVTAMKDTLARVNPHVEVVTHRVRLTAVNIPEIFAGVNVVAECFDRADQKQMIVETVLGKMKDTAVVSVSGLAGYGRSNIIQTRKLSPRHILVGDLESASGPGRGLMAPRVGVAAYHQANAIVELLVDGAKMPAYRHEYRRERTL